MALDVADRLRGFFFENLNLKLLSFAFALVLYSLVHDAQDAQRVLDVGVVVRVPPETSNRLLVSQSATRVRLTLRGSRAALDDIHVDDVGTLQIDAHGGTEKEVTLTTEMVHLPPGVRVEQIEPSLVTLQWEDEIVRDVPVEVSVVGTPANGYKVKGVPVAEPATIRVRGAKSQVLVMQHVRAEPFDVGGLTEGAYPRELAVDRRAGLRFDESEVKVTAQIARELDQRTFAKLPVAVLGVTKGHTQPADVDVRLVCPPEILVALRPEQIVPQVEVKGNAPSGAASLPVVVNVEKCDWHVTPGNVVVRW
jgi:hypothetical protein